MNTYFFVKIKHLTSKRPTKRLFTINDSFLLHHYFSKSIIWHPKDQEYCTCPHCYFHFWNQTSKRQPLTNTSAFQHRSDTSASTKISVVISRSSWNENHWSCSNNLLFKILLFAEITSYFRGLDCWRSSSDPSSSEFFLTFSRSSSDPSSSEFFLTFSSISLSQSQFVWMLRHLDELRSHPLHTRPFQTSPFNIYSNICKLKWYWMDLLNFFWLFLQFLCHKANLCGWGFNFATWR